MTTIETFEHNGHEIAIVADECAESPRKSCDNLGTFWTQERRCISPDDMPKGRNIFDSVAELFGGDATAESNAKALDRETIWLPVWKYEHGASCYRAADANPFHCPWDSGQAGVIFVSKSDVRKEHGVKRISPQVRAKVLQVLQAEVEAYSTWANGEYVGFIVTDSDGEHVDSCFGIDDIEYARSEAREMADSL